MPINVMVGYTGVVCVILAIGKKQESVLEGQLHSKGQDTENKKNANCVDLKHSRQIS